MTLTSRQSFGAPLVAAAIAPSTIYSPAQIFDAYAAYLGQPVTPQTATLIAAELRERYRNDGYARPRFTIIDNGVDTGVVRIALTETRISAVTVSGDAGPYRTRLEQLFKGLPSQAVLRPAQLQRLLHQARALPGLDIETSTRLDDRGAGVVLALDAQFESVHNAVQISNRGTRDTGRHIAHATFVKNGLLNGRTTAGLFVTSAADRRKYSGAGLYADSELGVNGGKAYVQIAHTALDITPGDVRLQQSRDRFTVRFSHSISRNANLDARVSAGFETDDLDVHQDGALSREDRLRSLTAGLSVDRRYGTARHLFSADWEIGLSGFGSLLRNYTHPSDARAREFVITRLHYIYLSRLADDWTLRSDLHAQHSAKILPSIKRFKVGGGRIGRGFEAAALDGDLGIGGKLELQRRLSVAQTLLQNAHVYGFYDIGAVWRNDQPGRESASSAGAGVALRAEQLHGYLEVARPLTHADADGRKDFSVFAQLTWQF